MRILFSPFLKNLLLWLLLSCMVGCSSGLPVVKRTASARTSDLTVWTADFRSNEQKNSYQVKFTTPKNSISGLCVLRMSDDKWQGMIVNEVGMSAFNFFVTDERCDLLNVMPMMDKWYIKKTIAADLFFFMHVDNPATPFYKRLERFEQNGQRVVNYKKKQVVVDLDGTVRLINKRRKLQYEWKTMVKLDPDKIIL